MADNIDVFSGIKKDPTISYPVLVPNLKGLEAAVSLNHYKLPFNNVCLFSCQSVLKKLQYLHQHQMAFQNGMLIVQQWKVYKGYKK